MDKAEVEAKARMLIERSIEKDKWKDETIENYKKNKAYLKRRYVLMYTPWYWFDTGAWG